MQVYLDNAATTAMDPLVVDRMAEVMRSVYGNPSAIHSIGRTARAEVELDRKSVAALLKCTAKEIYFTGSGTEADNMALRCAVNDLGVKVIITSLIEHKAVLDTAKDLEKKGLAKVLFVKLNEDGSADLEDLERLAKQYPGALISLMHANNEIGTINDLYRISAIARKSNCYFHSDTVQTMGHYFFDLSELDIDFITCSAHKFHGPKGIGFLYKNQKLIVRPIITGGGQESKVRAGTENTSGIAGLTKALEIAYENLNEEKFQIEELKSYTWKRLQESVPDVRVNGPADFSKALYTVLNVSLPHSDLNETLLFQLDIAGICVSGGSACNSGATGESHVLAGIGHDKDRAAIRISFSKYNSKEDIDFLVSTLHKMYAVTA